MRDDIKAIPTIWKGNRFRSRLEARWAVFFDALGWPYRYEEEGFALSDGTAYLPDFYLPDLKTYVEIKPEKPTLEEWYRCDNLQKCLIVGLFNGEDNEDQVWCIAGKPWPGEYAVIPWQYVIGCENVIAINPGDVGMSSAKETNDAATQT